MIPFKDAFGMAKDDQSDCSALVNANNKTLFCSIKKKTKNVLF